MENHLNIDLPQNFDSSSRVWLYQSDRLLQGQEIEIVLQQLTDFIEQWNTHGAKVKGYANVFFGWFIVLMADETVEGVSGCSTDSSVRQMKLLEQKLNISLFERQNLAFLVNDKVQFYHLSQIKSLIESGTLNGDSIYFNNLVQNKSELLENWMIPLRESWLGKRFEIPSTVS